MESVCFSLQAVVWLITTDQRSGTSACLHGLLHTSPPAPPPPLFLCTTPHIVCILLFKNHCNVTAYEYSAAMLSHYYSSLAVEAVTSGYSMCILSVLQPPHPKKKKKATLKSITRWLGDSYQSRNPSCPAQSPSCNFSFHHFLPVFEGCAPLNPLNWHCVI